MAEHVKESPTNNQVAICYSKKITQYHRVVAGLVGPSLMQFIDDKTVLMSPTSATKRVLVPMRVVGREIVMMVGNHIRVLPWPSAPGKRPSHCCHGAKGGEGNTESQPRSKPSRQWISQKPTQV